MILFLALEGVFRKTLCAPSTAKGQNSSNIFSSNKRVSKAVNKKSPTRGKGRHLEEMAIKIKKVIRRLICVLKRTSYKRAKIFVCSKTREMASIILPS